MPTEAHVTSQGHHSPRWWRMTLKELREILRDRRTILTLVVMPLLIYPLLGVTMQKLVVSQLSSKSKIEYRIALETERDAMRFRRLFGNGHVLVAAREGRQLSPDQRPVGSVDDPFIRLIVPNDPNVTADPAMMVRMGEADVGMRFGPHDPAKERLCEIVYRLDSSLSREVRRFLEERLRAVNENFAREFFAAHPETAVLPNMVKLSPIQMPLDPHAAPFSLATLVPLILILMTVTGAVYPAIDLTAGERERGTLEALISAPVPRHELLFAKYLAVLTVALLTALANLGSMVVTAYASGIDSLLFGPEGASARVLIATLGLLAVFAGFFSAVILLLTSFARSFKEAQAYLIPLMLVSLAPGVLCLLPGIEMNGWLSVMPLANIVLLARDIFEGHVVPIWALAALLSTVLYGVVSLSLAARIFGTDAVLYGSDGTWSDLVRRPSRTESAPSLTVSMGYLAFLFPAFLLFSSIPARMLGTDIIPKLIANAVITLGLFGVGPLVVSWWCRVFWREGLGWRWPSVGNVIAGLLLGVSLWPFAFESALLMQPPERSAAIEELMRTLVEGLNSVPLPLKLLLLAVIPAVSEELFFRGFLLGSLRTGMNSTLAVIFSALLFGLFHILVVSGDALFLERLVPTSLLGMVLGWLRVRTVSLVPGIVMHVTHNGLLLTIASYIKELSALGIGIEEKTHLPWPWLLGAVVITLLATGLLRKPVREASHE